MSKNSRHVFEIFPRGRYKISRNYSRLDQHLHQRSQKEWQLNQNGGQIRPRASKKRIRVSPWDYGSTPSPTYAHSLAQERAQFESARESRPDRRQALHPEKSNSFDHSHRRRQEKSSDHLDDFSPQSRIILMRASPFTPTCVRLFYSLAHLTSQ